MSTTGPGEVVIFRLDGQRCALALSAVQEIKRVAGHTPVHRAPPWVRGLVNMRGQVITLVDVRQRLGLTPRDTVGPSALAIIVQQEADLVGLLVDAVEDVVAAPPSDVRRPPANLQGVDARYVTAVIEQADGLVALLDKDRIAGRDGPRETA